MDDIEATDGVLKIDVKKVLYSKNPGLKKVVPKFLISHLKRIIHQDELNELLEKKGYLKDAEFIAASLEFLGIKYNVYGTENIPLGTRNIFVSNHPLGGLDGLVFINELSKFYEFLKFPVNDILLNIKNLTDIFLPINKHGLQNRESVKQIDQAYASENQILYFPAGLCSRRKNGVITDLEWQKSFINKAVQYKRDIVPAFFSGKNSSFFYTLANVRKIFGIKLNLEMLYLPDEMFKQKNKEIGLVFGEPISWQTFDKSKSATEWATWVRAKSYELGSVIKTDS